MPHGLSNVKKKLKNFDLGENYPSGSLLNQRKNKEAAEVKARGGNL